MIPPVPLKDILMIPSKCPWWLSLPEDARTRPDKVVVEEPLVEGVLPSFAVHGLQGFSGKGEGERLLNFIKKIKNVCPYLHFCMRWIRLEP
jgi:hypothetical protein